MIFDLVRKTRSCRRFKEKRPVSLETLKSLVDLGRLSASAANRQPLKYIVSVDPAINKKIFPCLAWAAYLRDWAGPAPGERPSGYIIILVDTRISNDYWCDHGIAGQSILLGAAECGLAGCFIGAINREQLREALSIDPHFKIELVIALGEPAETIVIESTADTGGDIRYWRDEKGIHHVPKRSLDEIMVNTFFR